MTSPPPLLSVSRLVRLALATASLVLFASAVVVRQEPRLFAAAAVCGVLWWAWDLILEYVFLPFGDWLTQTLLGGDIGVSRPDDPPDLEDLIRLLEGHIARGASQQVDIHAAIRLAEIYRTVKKDPERARAVIDLVEARYPGAPELERFRRASRQAPTVRGDRTDGSAGSVGEEL